MLVFTFQLQHETSQDEVDDEFGEDENDLTCESQELENLNKENCINDVPYFPLNTKSKLKKFNTRLSLEKLSDTEDDEEYYYESDEECQQNVADDNDNDAEYSDDEEQSNGILQCMNHRCFETQSSEFRCRIDF